MLDGAAQEFEAANPSMRARWEYLPANGDRTWVVAREALGFTIADASQLGNLTESQQKKGPVVRGDLILMYAPKEIVDMIAAEDAKAAEEDAKTPETTYREHIRSLRVKLSDGTVATGEPIGNVRRTQEERTLVAEPSQELER